jgi:hypothetical protein
MVWGGAEPTQEENLGETGHEKNTTIQPSHFMKMIFTYHKTGQMLKECRDNENSNMVK